MSLLPYFGCVITLLLHAGAEALANRLLLEAYVRVQDATKKELAKHPSTNLTVNGDGWTTIDKLSILLSAVLVPDAGVYVVDTEEATIEKHTAEFIAGAHDMAVQLLLAVLSHTG